jgi:hypothetical protein
MELSPLANDDNKCGERKLHWQCRENKGQIDRRVPELGSYAIGRNY